MTPPSIRIARALGWGMWWVGIYLMVLRFFAHGLEDVDPGFLILGFTTLFIVALPKNESSNNEQS